MIPGILALALIAGLLVVTRTWEYGIGLSPDSVDYISMARKLATGYWETSPSIAWARREDSRRLLSNRADALYLLVPGAAVGWLPREEATLSATVSSIGERRVVWFHGTSYPYDLRDLASALGLEDVVEFDDGVVFEASQP